MLAALFDTLMRRRLKKSHRPVGGYVPKQVACFDCGIRHELPHDLRQALASAGDFFDRHDGHQVNWLEQPGYAGLMYPNADVKQSFQAIQTFTVTNLHSLASSVTVGWQSAVVDNTANLYLDDMTMVNLDFANTAPANSKACFLYSYGGIESGVYTYPASGSEGSITLSDITANATNIKRIGTVAYLVQDAVIPAGPFSVAVAHGGVLPGYWGICLMNHSGAALAATGNTVKHLGVFLTIV